MELRAKKLCCHLKRDVSVVRLPGGSTGLACSAFGEAVPVTCEAVCVAGEKDMANRQSGRLKKAVSNHVKFRKREEIVNIEQNIRNAYLLLLQSPALFRCWPRWAPTATYLRLSCKNSGINMAK